ncbi:MAG: acyltransferase [Nocardia sp.]|nr:acyltransferase [Nocardia sp.]
MSTMIAAPATEHATTAASARPQPSRPYLHQVSLFRILTFMSVIGIHILDRTGDPDSVTGNGVMLLLHFPREAFFTLTAFVLMYQYADRSFSAPHFWRRRFKLVGIPYVLWSVFYWAYSIISGASGIQQESPGAALRRLAVELLTGEAWYQLYFLLVSMQIYLLFPVLLQFVRRTAGYHKWILAAGAAIQAGLLWSLSHPPTLSGLPAALWNHIYVTVLPYQFYILFGAITAWHIGSIDRVVRRFGPLILLGTVAAGAFAELCYLHSVHRGLPAWQADNVFNPYLAVYFVALIAGFYTLSTWWSWLRPKFRAVGVISKYGADRSFAVFLIHPIVLELLMARSTAIQHHLGMAWGSIVVFAMVLAVTLAVVEVVRHAPGSLWLTGRARIEGPTALGRWIRSLSAQPSLTSHDATTDSAAALAGSNRN